MPLREKPAKSSHTNDGPEDDPAGCDGGAEIPRLPAPFAAEFHRLRPVDATTSFPSRHFQVPDFALGSPAKDTNRIPDASIVTPWNSRLRPLAQTPVKGNNSRNFRHWSLKPHMEYCGSCLWAVSASSIHLEWNWFGRKTDTNHRNAPDGMVRDDRTALRQVQVAPLNCCNRERAQICRLVGSLQDRVLSCCDCPGRTLESSFFADRPAAQLEECGGQRFSEFSSGFHETAILGSRRREGR
jgi:hypothetical protein